jgi:hypothetical protein
MHVLDVIGEGAGGQGLIAAEATTTLKREQGRLDRLAKAQTCRSPGWSLEFLHQVNGGQMPPFEFERGEDAKR